MSELLPCPFCGNAPNVELDGYRVTCSNPECRVVVELMDDDNEIIPKIWNTRPCPEWQPISSAPKDGTVILGCSGDGSDYRVFSMKWDIESEHGSYGWIDPDWDGGYDPVNWQPLPQPPHPEQGVKSCD